VGHENTKIKMGKERMRKAGWRCRYKSDKEKKKRVMDEDMKEIIAH
jgi:DNA-binding transcriptional regulator PaaX